MNVVLVLLCLVVFPQRHTDLRDGHARTVAIHQKGEQLFGFRPLKGEFFTLGIHLEIAEAAHLQRFFTFAAMPGFGTFEKYETIELEECSIP